MAVHVALLVGAPRSGTTMLERVLASHPSILGGPEPHLLTPLAHLGVWSNVQKAPYDHIIASMGQKDFIRKLPRQDEDYWAACRAYCEVLYGRALQGSGKSIYLDKTPENATILPFIAKVLPEAKYIVLTRHPVAVFCSFAQSFFGGDFARAHAHDPILQRYVPALASFIRAKPVGFIHVRYEDFVTHPDDCVSSIYGYLGVEDDPATLDYASRAAPQAGLGDPLGVRRHTRPSTESLTKWAGELRQMPEKLRFVQSLVERLDPADLETLGYPLDTLWAPLDTATSDPPPRRGAARDWGSTKYALERKAIVGGREIVRRSATLQRWIHTARLACDVLLRER